MVELDGLGDNTRNDFCSQENYDTFPCKCIILLHCVAMFS